MSGQWTRFVAPHRHPSIGDLLLLFCLHSAWVCCPILAILVSHLRLRVCVWMDGKNISVDRHLQSVLAEPVEIDRGRASEVYPTNTLLPLIPIRPAVHIYQSSPSSTHESSLDDGPAHQSVRPSVQIGFVSFTFTFQTLSDTDSLLGCTAG